MIWDNGNYNYSSLLNFLTKTSSLNDNSDSHNWNIFWVDLVFDIINVLFLPTYIKIYNLHRSFFLIVKIFNFGGKTNKRSN